MNNEREGWEFKRNTIETNPKDEIQNKGNKKGSLPKIKSDISVEGFEKDENNKNDPKITKIIRKTHSKSNIRQSSTKI